MDLSDEFPVDLVPFRGRSDVDGFRPLLLCDLAGTDERDKVFVICYVIDVSVLFPLLVFICFSYVARFFRKQRIAAEYFFTVRQGLDQQHYHGDDHYDRKQPVQQTSE